MDKKRLSTIDPEHEGLGRDSIMDPTLAMRWGVPYVHLAAFAIDLDRVEEAVAEDPEGVWPFGFEVFLTEVHLLGTLDADNPEHMQLLEDLCTNVMEQLPLEEPPLGAHVVFAVYDAVRRGELPKSLERLFNVWERPPLELMAELAPLWERPEVEAADLALACIEVELRPPLSPPTADALASMVETFETDDAADLPDEPS